jgi:hypothetical protein
VLARYVDARVLRVLRNIFNTDTRLSRFGRTAVAGVGGGVSDVVIASATHRQPAFHP